MNKFRALSTVFYALSGNKYIGLLIASFICDYKEYYKRGDLKAVMKFKNRYL